MEKEGHQKQVVEISKAPKNNEFECVVDKLYPTREDEETYATEGWLFDCSFDRKKYWQS